MTCFSLFYCGWNMGLWEKQILNVFAFYTVTQLFLSLELYQSLLPSQPNTVSSARKNTFAEKSGEMKFLPWVFGLARGVAQPFRRSSKWNHNSYRLRDPAEVLLAFEWNTSQWSVSPFWVCPGHTGVGNLWKNNTKHILKNDFLQIYN